MISSNASQSTKNYLLSICCYLNASRLERKAQVLFARSIKNINAFIHMQTCALMHCENAKRPGSWSQDTSMVSSLTSKYQHVQVHDIRSFTHMSTYTRARTHTQTPHTQRTALSSERKSFFGLFQKNICFNIHLFLHLSILKRKDPVSASRNISSLIPLYLPRASLLFSLFFHLRVMNAIVTSAACILENYGCSCH